jgi:hypothetical protein
LCLKKKLKKFGGYYPAKASQTQKVDLFIEKIIKKFVMKF